MKILVKFLPNVHFRQEIISIVRKSQEYFLGNRRELVIISFAHKSQRNLSQILSSKIENVRPQISYKWDDP